MSKNSLKSAPQTKVNLKKVLIYVVVIGISFTGIWLVLFGVGGLIIPKVSMAFPPPPPAGAGVAAPTGPGGVGTADGSSSLKIWYRTDKGVVSSGTSVTGWTNSAGIPDLDLVETGTNRPSVVSGAVNGYNEISFTSNAHWLKTASGVLTTDNFVTDQASTFVVNRADVTNQASCLYTTDPLVGNSRFTNHVPWHGTVYNDIGTCCNQNARIQVSGLTGLTNYSIWSYDANPATGKQLYRNGNLLQSRPNTSLYHSHSTQRFRIGRNFKGDVTEVIIFKDKINNAQRIIVENYLSGKFDVGLTTNDLYTQDEPSNGDFDHDIAGVGRIDASNLHADAQGTGIVRVMNPVGLGDNEFMFWGHQNGTLLPTNVVDVPANVDSRSERVWAVNEVDMTGNPIDIGAIDISFDLTDLGSFNVAELRLLVDTDADGSFTDETAISGATLQSGSIAVFSGVTEIQNDVKFSIGFSSTSALPIELLSFDAQIMDEEYVQIEWVTASEINNDYFTLEKSTDGIIYEEIGEITGAGNSSQATLYEFEDYDLTPGKVYYRLTQTDFNGDFEVFAPKLVEYQKSVNELVIESVGPIPFSDYFTLNYSVSMNMPIELILTNMSGKEVAHNYLDAEEGINEYVFSDGSALMPGIYLLTLKDEQGDVATEKVVKE